LHSRLKSRQIKLSRLQKYLTAIKLSNAAVLTTEGRGKNNYIMIVVVVVVVVLMMLTTTTMMTMTMTTMIMLL
jgi:hypothetical protein